MQKRALFRCKLQTFFSQLVFLATLCNKGGNFLFFNIFEGVSRQVVSYVFCCVYYYYY